MSEKKGSAKPLEGLSALITRPEGQAEELLKIIESAGGRAYHFPVMKIKGVDVGDDNGDDNNVLQISRQTVLNLDHYQHVIVISTNAANFGLNLIDQYWPQLPNGLHWYAIGSATAMVLKEQQIRVETTGRADEEGQMNSEALLTHPKLQKLKHQKVLIIRGVGGRDYLREQLTARGAQVEYLECYRRQMVDSMEGELMRFISVNTINALCINSAESIDYFSTLVGVKNLSAVTSLPLVVPSSRVAEHALKTGYSSIIIAKNASNIAVANALGKIEKYNENI